MRTKGVDTGSFNNFTIDNFEFKKYLFGDCNKSQIVRLDPCACSDNSFFIDKNDLSINHKKDVLRIKASGKVYSNYCILFNEDSTHTANVCVDEENTSYFGDR